MTGPDSEGHTYELFTMVPYETAGLITPLPTAPPGIVPNITTEESLS